MNRKVVRMKIMKNSEKLKILGITVNDLQFLFYDTKPYYSVYIALTGQIIDRGYILDISNSSINTDHFINDWMNAVSDNFVIPEYLIKEFEEKQRAVSFKEINPAANDIIQQLKEQNNILKSIDNHLDKLVRRPIK